jgi:hypothetical protein
MKKVTIRPKGTLVVQFMANTDVECVTDGSTIYVPLVPGIEQFAPEKVVKTQTVSNNETDLNHGDEEQVPRKVAEKPIPTGGKKYSEEEMMTMDTKELEKICTKLGIDYDKYPGKNTNKKLRLLILEAQDGGSSNNDEERPTKSEKDAPAENSGIAKKVKDILSQLDEGELTEAKAEVKLVELGLSKKDAKTVVADFMDNPDIKIDKFINDEILPLIDSIEEEEEEYEEEKPRSKKSKDTEEVSEDDLEVGDEVSVYWKSQKEWYNGTVKAINRKGTLIAYEDETEEYLDSEENTRIKRLS